MPLNYVTGTTDEPEIAAPEEREYTPEEIMQTCIHSDACRRMAKVARLQIWYDNQTPIDRSEALAMGCDHCDAYEDRICPMSYSGTMRCRGPR